jgi:hypothetical protein
LSALITVPSGPALYRCSGRLAMVSARIRTRHRPRWSAPRAADAGRHVYPRHPQGRRDGRIISDIARILRAQRCSGAAG